MPDVGAGPLKGVRILELSNIIAGPTACQVLADFGAEVIKIEHPQEGDGLRRMGGQKNGHPLWWKMLGRNKRSVGMYLGDPEAADVFLKLVETADVVVEGFRAGTLEKWDLGYERLCEANPGIILARLTGFGQTGPYASRPAFGSNLEAMAGLTALTGEADGPPLMSVYALGDYFAGFSFLSSIMMALYYRDARGGTGQVIDASILSPLITMMTKPILSYEQLNILERRTGNRTANAVPRNAFKTRDNKWVNVTAATSKTAARIMELVGRSDIASESWFSIGKERLARIELIEGAIALWMGQHTCVEVLEAADAAGVTIAPINEISDLVSDPHINATEMLVTIEDPDLGTIRMPNVLCRMTRTPGSIRWTGEKLGYSTDEVLSNELGLPKEKIEAMRSRGVIA